MVIKAFKYKLPESFYLTASLIQNERLSDLLDLEMITSTSNASNANAKKFSLDWLKQDIQTARNNLAIFNAISPLEFQADRGAYLMEQSLKRLMILSRVETRINSNNK